MTVEELRGMTHEDLVRRVQVEKPLNFDPFGHARFAHLFVLYD